MKWLEAFKGLKRSEHRLAWMVALAADGLQLALFPLFGPGALSGADDALDFVVAVVLIRLLGWHWAFLPSIIAELLPGFDLFPTWTAAVFFVTRKSNSSTEPEILPPAPSSRAPL